MSFPDSNLLKLGKNFCILVMSIGFLMITNYFFSFIFYEKIKAKIVDFKITESFKDGTHNRGYNFKVFFFHPIVETDHDGKKIRAIATNGFPQKKYSAGEFINVIFNKKNPDEVTVINYFLQFILPICIFAFGLILFFGVKFAEKINQLFAEI